MQRTARQAAQDGTRSLKWQILLTLGVSLLLIMLLVSLATLFILWPGYQSIEEGEADNHLLRLHNAILDAQHSLASTAGDWSHWDDTYQFIAGQNPGYIDANMQPSGMHNNQLASISLFDQRGQLRWSGSLAPDGASLQDTSPLLLQRLQRLLQAGQPASGLVSDGQDVFLYARQDVRDSNLSLPANGNLLMTRRLDTLRLGTQLNLPALQQQLLSGAQPASRQSQILDPQQRRNQLSLPLAGSPHSLQLTFDSPRHITRLATASLQTGGQLTLLGIFGCLLVAWWQMQRRISRPLACMARAITSLASHPGQLQQLEPLASRRDEIGTVAREICQMHQRILSLSSLDPLTGLPNRRQFDQRLDAHLHSTPRPKSFSLCFIDLDRFKPVNDQYGHKTGDHLLQELAQRMSLHLRSQDTLARIGGDEFVLILDQVHEETRIRPILQRLLDDIRQIQEIDGHPVSIDASIGVASYPRDAHDLHELLQQADMAMYRSKQQGGGGICLASELPGPPADYQNPQLHTYGRPLDENEPPPA